MPGARRPELRPTIETGTVAPIIEARDVVKRFSADTLVLDGVSLSIPSGDDRRMTGAERGRHDHAHRGALDAVATAVREGGPLGR